MSTLAVRLWRRATRPPAPRDEPRNPMRRGSDRRTWTGSPLSIAAPGLLPPSALATLDQASGFVLAGALLVGIVVGLLGLARHLSRTGAHARSTVAGVVACGVGYVAVLVIALAVAVAQCAPDAFGCPLA